VPAEDDRTIRLCGGDCRAILPTFPNDSVQLVVTSPPYNVGKRYGDDGSGDRLPLDEYLTLLSDVFAELYRVLQPGGVLALNLPPSIRVPGRYRAFPLAAWAELRLQETGWILGEELTWVKTTKDGRLLATHNKPGSFINPARRQCSERIIVAHKATYLMAGKRAWPSEIRYIECLKDVWLLPPGRCKRSSPVAFPDELVRRLVLLYSCPDDVVLDPFAGTGTVGRVTREHGRRTWLIKREPTYWPLIEAALNRGGGS
jgi:site-specific DNA-methyltransferase (adenine-specific)